MEVKQIVSGLNDSAQEIFAANKAKGFWDKERNVGEMLMLVTTELAEAMDAHQKGYFASRLNYEEESNECFEDECKDTFEDELGDAIIRLLDMTAGLGIDIERHINLKLAYNRTRERLHGKKY
tara:strand:- start:3582 stop:3950 length:369 start_codon:yes stop_codon:yes gene_type:complete